MSKHTPGPWVVNGFGGGFTVIARTQPHGVAVSAVSDQNDGIANARLIAAAPELLKACELALKSWFSGEICEREMEVVLRSAVAKATGR